MARGQGKRMFIKSIFPLAVLGGKKSKKRKKLDCLVRMILGTARMVGVVW